MFEKALSENISRTGKFSFLKIGTLYQENMTNEEVARREFPSSGSPDTDNFRKYFESEYLDKQQIYLAENSYIVPREHDQRRGGTTRVPVERFS